MTTPEFIIVGRIRKAHGVRGELVVESITDEPDVIFTPGRRVFAGNANGDITTARQELHITSARDFNDGLLLHFEEIGDRNAADLWRGRYLLTLASELSPPE